MVGAWRKVWPVFRKDAKFVVGSGRRSGGSTPQKCFFLLFSMSSRGWGVIMEHGWITLGNLSTVPLEILKISKNRIMNFFLFFTIFKNLLNLHIKVPYNYANLVNVQCTLISMGNIFISFPKKQIEMKSAPHVTFFFQNTRTLS